MNLAALNLESNSTMEHFDEFNEVLVDAISAFMQVCDRAGLVWQICDINLKHVVEREIYFKCVVNLEQFYKYYYLLLLQQQKS